MRQAIRKHRSFRLSTPKRILLALAVLGISYSALWMIAASRFKQAIASQLSTLSERKNVTLDYDTLSIQGYPFRIEVQIHQPKLQVDLAYAMHEVHPDTPEPNRPDTSNSPLPPSGQDTQNLPSVPAEHTDSTRFSDISSPQDSIVHTVVMPASDGLSSQEAHYEFYTDGAVGLSTNFLGKHLRATLYGDGHQLLRQGSNSWHALMRAKNPLRMDVALFHSFFPDVVFSSFGHLDNFTSIQSNIRAFDVETGGVSVLNGDNNNLLRSADAVRIQLGNVAVNGSDRSLHLDVLIKNVVSTPAFDAFYTTLSDAFPDFAVLNNLPLPLFSSHSSAYGSINANIDMDVTYPNNPADFALLNILSLNHPMEIAVNHLEITTGLNANTLQGSLRVFSNGADASKPLAAHLIVHSTHENSEEGYQTELAYLKENLLRTKPSVETAPSQQLALLDYLKAHPDELPNITPKLYEMGKIETNMDIELTSEQSLIVHQADFKTRDYTLKLTGEYRQPDKASLLQIAGKGKMILEVTHYRQLTADATHYLARLLTVFNKASSLENSPVIFSEQFKTDLDTLLVALSDHPDSTTDAISITVKNEGDQFLPTVGTLPLFQAASKVQEIMQPHFTPASTSGSSTAPLVPAGPVVSETPASSETPQQSSPSETTGTPQSPLLDEKLH